MRIGIVGLPQSGKTSVFTALTGEGPGADAAAGRTVTKVVRVPDKRLEKLREIFKPKSFKPATFEVADFGAGVSKEARMATERESDSFIVVLNGFAPKANPEKELADLDTDWTLADLQPLPVRKAAPLAVPPARAAASRPRPTTAASNF